MRAHEFYEKYGGLTIILARFMPIVRTFAPFVAGIGKMSYPRFAVYNVVGGAVWVVSFLVAGWWFGGLEIVQKNFHLVIVAIIVISVLPACGRTSCGSGNISSKAPSEDVVRRAHNPVMARGTGAYSVRRRHRASEGRVARASA